MAFNHEQKKPRVKYFKVPDWALIKHFFINDIINYIIKRFAKSDQQNETHIY